MKFKIEQFYHTTLENPEDSPYGIKGFHTIFYPHSFLNKDDLYSLEKWIQIPFAVAFISKDIFFFKEINEIIHLVIMRITKLPGAADFFGRRDGVYQCQGFICPPGVWQMLPTPHSLVRLIESRMIPNREAALDSPSVERSTGEMSPLEISSEDLSVFAKDTYFRLSSPFEVKLAILVRRLAIGKFKEHRILIRGDSHRTVSIMNKICLFVPVENWSYLSFDPVLDGLQLHPLPVKVAGCYETLPRGGNPIIVNLEQECFEDDTGFTLSQPQNQFEEWLLMNTVGIEANSYEIRNLIEISNYLIMKLTPPFNGHLPDEPDFMESYRQVVDNRYVDLCEDAFGELICRALPFVPYRERFATVISGISGDMFADFEKAMKSVNPVEPKKKNFFSKSKEVIKKLSGSFFKNH